MTPPEPTSPHLGICTTIAPLRRVLLHHPSEALTAEDAAAWGYPRARDLGQIDAEFRGFCALLQREGVEIHVDEASVGVDAVYACDPLLPTPWGPVVTRMGKGLRGAEPAAAAAHLQRLGIAPLATLATGHVEGGDVLWLARDLVLVGVGDRSDPTGVDAFEALLAPRGVRVRRVELPWRDGPDVCLHLRSLINVLDRDLAIVDRPWLPTTLLRELEARGIRLIDADPGEIATQGNNILVLRPRVVALTAGNPRTEATLHDAGVTVHRFAGQALCVEGTGGPTCLCFDLWREGPDTMS